VITEAAVFMKVGCPFASIINKPEAVLSSMVWIVSLPMKDIPPLGTLRRRRTLGALSASAIFILCSGENIAPRADLGCPVSGSRVMCS